MKGGAPRAVWLPVYADPMTVSARAVAERLIELGRPSHLVWNPLSGDVAQLIPAVRAARALGWAEGQGWGPGQRGRAGDRARGGTAGLGQRIRLGAGSVPGARDGGGGPRLGRNSDWMHPGDWLQRQPAEDHEWAHDPDWTPGTGSTHGADWTQGIGWTHGSGGRPMVAAAAGLRRSRPRPPPGTGWPRSTPRAGSACRSPCWARGGRRSPTARPSGAGDRQLARLVAAWPAAGPRGTPRLFPAPPGPGSGAAAQLGPGRPLRRRPGARLRGAGPGASRSTG